MKRQIRNRIIRDFTPEEQERFDQMAKQAEEERPEIIAEYKRRKAEAAAATDHQKAAAPKTV